MEKFADQKQNDCPLAQEEEDEEESRRHSQSSQSCSNSSQTTASIKDLSEVDGIPANDDRGIIEDVNCNYSDSDATSRYTDIDREFMDWTKKFHSLVDEAPLLQATIISNRSLENGISIQKTENKGKENEETLDYGDSEKTVEYCDWVDLELLEEGRRFVRKNFFAVFLANLIGVAFLLTVRPIQSLLLRTSALHRKENSMRRYVKLMLYLKRFYETPSLLVKSSKTSAATALIIDDKLPSNDRRNDIGFIHNLQRNAAKNFKVYVPPPWEDLRLTLGEQEVYSAIQEDMKQLSGISTNTKYMPKVLFTVNPDVPMSQYDLVVIQHVFFGLIAQFPKVFGIHGRTDRAGNPEGLKGFIHLWAVLGHVFGIEERFNMCIPHNYDAETNQLIFKQVLLFSLKSVNETAMRLWRVMTSRSSKYFFFLRTKAMLLFMCKDVAKLDSCKYLHSVMKPMERFSYYFYKFLIHWILWIPPFRMGLNFSFLISIRICQYFLNRSKKCESKWESTSFSVCVIDPSFTPLSK